MSNMKMNSVDEVKELSVYLKGMADGTKNNRLQVAADWLEKLSRHVCGQGFVGCTGGVECDWDHK